MAAQVLLLALQIRRGQQVRLIRVWAIPKQEKNVIGAQNEAKAKAALGMADSYKSAGNTAKARKKYQEVIAQYPGTPQAATAKKTLSELPAD